MYCTILWQVVFFSEGKSVLVFCDCCRGLEHVSNFGAIFGLLVAIATPSMRLFDYTNKNICCMYCVVNQLVNQTVGQ